MDCFFVLDLKELLGEKRKITFVPHKEQCPFGGPSQIIVCEDEQGVLWGKCELAERLWLERDETFWLLRTDLNKKMKQEGCPHPIKQGIFGGWSMRCKYNFGRWAYM